MIGNPLEIAIGLQGLLADALAFIVGHAAAYFIGIAAGVLIGWNAHKVKEGPG